MGHFFVSTYTPSVDGGTLESARITEEAPILPLFEILLQYIL